MKNTQPKTLFSDFFQIDKNILDQYGAFDISLITDLPLFIDPFLLFNSSKPEYQKLHEEMIDYLRFLHDKSLTQEINKGLLAAWFRFKEIKQNWLGFSVDGNRGSALGHDFAQALYENFSRIFSNYGKEKITKSSHLEKLCLVKDGVGKDNISDFTTNLILDYLLCYTQEFAKQYIDSSLCKEFRIPRARFNYNTETWEEDSYYLPYINDYIILTPKDLLTKDETWINKSGLVKDFQQIPTAISNEELRAKINNYFQSILPKRPKKKEEKEAAMKTILKFPEIIDYYIRYKEEHENEATSISTQKVEFSEKVYIEQSKALSYLLASKSDFYKIKPDSYKEAMRRIQYLRKIIEDNDGYRIFYDKNKCLIGTEEDLNIMFRLVWIDSDFDFNTEVNNGRGPVDAKISKGSQDKTLVELKLASNTQLEKNLANQLEIYKKANNTQKGIKVIIFFSRKDHIRVQKILKRLDMLGDKNIILIDARSDNKPSASKV